MLCSHPMLSALHGHGRLKMFTTAALRSLLVLPIPDRVRHGNVANDSERFIIIKYQYRVYHTNAAAFTLMTVKSDNGV